MTEKTLKSYQQEGIRIQFVQIIYADHAEYYVFKNRRKISKSIRYTESLRTFRKEVNSYINQFQLF